jgi:hypothetical protein
MVHLELTDRHRATALPILEGFVERLFPDRARRLVVVDNAQRGDLEIELDRRACAISGDNRSREFSGWDRGLAWLEADGSIRRDTPVVLTNDTFHRSYGAAYLSDFSPERVLPPLSRGALIGYMDAYPRAIRLFQLTLERWVRSSLVISTYGSLAHVRPFALPFSDDDVFSHDFRQLFCEPSPLSDNYRRYLRTWLFGDAPSDGFDEAWHSRAPLGPETFEAAKGKIRSILCEHALSARALAAGLALIDTRGA